MTRDDEQLHELFLEKIKFIEENNPNKNFDFYTYFLMQVGPKDAQNIINQMEAFFVSGYHEGQKDDRAW